MNTDAALILRCQQGDRRAQQALYSAYAGRMMPVCLRYLKHLPAAEDALVQGFTKFFGAVGRFQYRGEGSLGAYLKGVMVNECLMQLRKTVLVQTMDDLAPFETVHTAEDDALSSLGAKEILAHIAALPDGYRTIFNLYEIEGYSHREISEALTISEGTSKSQLSKAKAALRLSLTERKEHHAQRR